METVKVKLLLQQLRGKEGIIELIDSQVTEKAIYLVMEWGHMDLNKMIVRSLLVPMSHVQNLLDE